MAVIDDDRANLKNMDGTAACYGEFCIQGIVPYQSFDFFQGR